jgi:hypothetical protein
MEEKEMGIPVFQNSKSWMRVGTLSLILALLALRFVRPNATLTEDAADAIKGFLMGVSIACNLMAIRLRQRGNRADNCA